MKESLCDILERSPVIAGVKDEKALQAALISSCDILFLYFGNICNIASLVERVHSAGKLALLHLDFIEGLSNQVIVLDFIRDSVKADGIISSKAPMLRAAQKRRLFTVHRYFLIDSFSYHSLSKQYEASQADIIEIVPGCVQPRVLKWVQEALPHVPVIASGLVCEKEFVTSALGAGAVAVSTTCAEIWDAL